jgi:hypothetical protein
MSTANSVVDGFSVPDILLPWQHFNLRTKHLEPEKQLMLAVLTDAVRCFRMGSACGRPRRRLFADAEWWLFRLREMAHFSSRTSVMRWKSIPAGSDAGCLIGATASLAGEASRMIRRPPVLPVKQASGSASMSRREKNQRRQ